MNSKTNTNNLLLFFGGGVALLDILIIFILGMVGMLNIRSEIASYGTYESGAGTVILAFALFVLTLIRNSMKPFVISSFSKPDKQTRIFATLMFVSNALLLVPILGFVWIVILPFITAGVKMRLFDFIEAMGQPTKIYFAIGPLIFWLLYSFVCFGTPKFDFAQDANTGIPDLIKPIIWYFGILLFELIHSILEYRTVFKIHIENTKTNFALQ